MPLGSWRNLPGACHGKQEKILSTEQYVLRAVFVKFDVDRRLAVRARRTVRTTLTINTLSPNLTLM